jgi:hypothetical protein
MSFKNNKWTTQRLHIMQLQWISTAVLGECVGSAL